MTQTLDCQACGACCVSPFVGEGYIHLTRQEEEERCSRLKLPVLEVMAEAEGERVVLLGTRINRAGRRVCTALEGTVGRHVSCRIYEERPSLCREFEAGSEECLQARRAAGIRS